MSNLWVTAVKHFSSGSGRWVHVMLPPDAVEAHRLLLSLAAGRTGAALSPPEVIPYDQQRLRDLRGSGGFTTHPWRDSPTKGYMASFDDPDHRGFAQVHHLGDLTPEHIAAHRTLITPHLMEGGYQGGWLDRSEHRVYLDSSKRHDKESKARAFAVSQRQKAYYDLGKGTDYYLDPRHDPKYSDPDHEDLDGWAKKYAHVGLAPAPGYSDYAHLYPLPGHLQSTARWAVVPHPGRAGGPASYTRKQYLAVLGLPDCDRCDDTDLVRLGYHDTVDHPG